MRGASPIFARPSQSAHPEEPLSLSKRRLEGLAPCFETGLRQAQSLLSKSGKTAATCLLATALLTTPAHAADRQAARVSLGDSATYFFSGNMRAARIEAMNAVKADPQWGLARAMLARTQIALGDGPGAEAELNRAVKAGMSLAQLTHLGAHAALMQGDAPRALILSRRPVKSPISEAYARRIEAAALAATGEMDAAANAYDAAVATNPDSSMLWTDISRFRLRQGNVGGAGTAAARAVELDPANVEALILSGQLVRGQYGLIASLEWFDRALSVDPNNLVALGELAATHGDSGRYGEMLRITRRILAIDPVNPRALYLQAVMAARAGQYEVARTLVYKIGDRMGDVAGMQLLKGVLALEAGAWEQAKLALEPLQWNQRSNLVARRLYGLALLKSGETKQAFFRLAPLGDRADADSYTLLTLAGMQEGIDNARGAALLRDRAAKSGRVIAPPFDLYGSFRPDVAASGRDDNADVAIPRIASLMASGNAAAARPLALDVARRNPGAAGAQMLLGDVLEASGSVRGAAEAYRRAANIEFTENVALRLTSALQRSGQGAAAFNVLDTFLAQNPRNLPMTLLAANAQLQRGQWDDAIATINSVRLRIGNRDPVLLTGLGWAWYKKGDVARGLTYSDAALRMAPGNPVVAGTNGWMRFESGNDPKGGRALLVKAAKIAPDNAQLREWLGKARG
jgi:cellulose synthase operon protein C